jgi:hypothetical protein
MSQQMWKREIEISLQIAIFEWNIFKGSENILQQLHDTVIVKGCLSIDDHTTLQSLDIAENDNRFWGEKQNTRPHPLTFNVTLCLIHGSYIEG